MNEEKHYKVYGVGFTPGRIHIMRLPKDLMNNPEASVLHPELKVTVYQNASENWYNTFFAVCNEHFERRIDRNEGKAVQFGLRKVE